MSRAVGDDPRSNPSKKNARLKTATASNNSTTAAALPSPSPRNNSQSNNSQQAHAASDLHGPALLRLGNEGAGLGLVEVYAAVRAPVDFGRGSVEGVDEGALEDVAAELLDREAFAAVFALLDGVGEVRCAVLGREEAFAAEGEDWGVGGAVEEGVAVDLERREISW